MSYGARVIEIGFWSDPIDERVVKERLGTLFAFVEMAKPQEGAHWALRFALHPITQDWSSVHYVGEACRVLQVPKGTRIAWSDSAEVGK